MIDWRDFMPDFILPPQPRVFSSDFIIILYPEKYATTCAHIIIPQSYNILSLCVCYRGVFSDICRCSLQEALVSVAMLAAVWIG